MSKEKISFLLVSSLPINEKLTTENEMEKLAAVALLLLETTLHKTLSSALVLLATENETKKRAAVSHQPAKTPAKKPSSRFLFTYNLKLTTYN